MYSELNHQDKKELKRQLKIELDQQAVRVSGKSEIPEEKVSYHSGQVLHDKNIYGQERPWQKRKIENVRYAEYLEILEFKKAHNVHDCAETIKYRVTDNGEMKLYQVWFCKSRLCPLCNWRRANKSAKQLEMILNEAVKRQPKARFFFLTLTTRNTYNKEGLKKELGRFGRAVYKLMQYKKVSKNLLGYVRSTEITVNEDGSYHQHMHLLVMVKNTYFKDSGNYLSQSEWTKLWQRAMKLGYTPIVNVEAVKANRARGKGSLKASALETAKYQTKSADYMTKDDERNLTVIDDLEFALKGSRQVSFAGLLKEIRKDLQLDDVENGDLIHANSENEKLPEVVKVAVAKFDYQRMNYFWR
ncbi:protein rep [Chryseobacterium sp.]|jgi:plasmid rolling circle replication initiator protein Rep|uniref:protein rep n=1 Tax=Chryseobacterium sp. TaxID=1871047 RepID=UPI0025BDF43B|nr:protein rep [Chryseobacterium sp.]